jgi:hypothetical protein
MENIMPVDKYVQMRRIFLQSGPVRAKNRPAPCVEPEVEKIGTMVLLLARSDGADQSVAYDLSTGPNDRVLPDRRK